MSHRGYPAIIHTRTLAPQNRATTLPTADRQLIHDQSIFSHNLAESTIAHAKPPQIGIIIIYE